MFVNNPNGAEMRWPPSHVCMHDLFHHISTKIMVSTFHGVLRRFEMSSKEWTCAYLSFNPQLLIDAAGCIYQPRRWLTGKGGNHRLIPVPAGMGYVSCLEGTICDGVHVVGNKFSPSLKRKFSWIHRRFPAHRLGASPFL